MREKKTKQKKCGFETNPLRQSNANKLDDMIDVLKVSRTEMTNYLRSDR